MTILAMYWIEDVDEEKLDKGKHKLWGEEGSWTKNVSEHFANCLRNVCDQSCVRWKCFTMVLETAEKCLVES